MTLSAPRDAAPPEPPLPSGGTPLKALTLTQPWASLVAIGAKEIETRSWTTRHRGWLAIHAAAGWDAAAKAAVFAAGIYEHLHFAGLAWQPPSPPVPGGRPHDARSVPTPAGGRGWHALPLGQIVALAYLERIHHTEDVWRAPDPDGYPWTDAARAREEVLGDYSAGRAAWVFTRVVRLFTPISTRGQLGVWDLDATRTTDVAWHVRQRLHPSAPEEGPDDAQPAAP